MLTFEEALEKLCVIPENMRGEGDESQRLDFTKPQLEFTADITNHPPVKIMCDMTVQTVVQLLMNQGIVPELSTVARECYLNGLILGVSIGVQMERNNAEV